MSIIDNRAPRSPILALMMTLALAAAAHPAAAGERMTTGEIEATFSGMTLDGIYRSGEFFSETYRDDGSIRYHGTEGADMGEWSAEGGRFCTFYESADGGCFFVDRDGANCFTFTVDEGTLNPKPARDWTSRGWDRTRPSTCPKAPEAST
ncbi:hypothetical protein SAMN02745157_2232 [Kaistia soli DSM 19436]|uniref:Uncharacterized protein n=1 Tax=Kaistia soli DSM 19436 TaxID=1122133 RepID=A0A1M5C6F3_9HYPH|nr:hypothetical protein [Kaistia soli]SHF50260.1 hypothetical protein SAMN02745157_2232 [Kaistia soli DSM 19436]